MTVMMTASSNPLFSGRLNPQKHVLFWSAGLISRGWRLDHDHSHRAAPTCLHSHLASLPTAFPVRLDHRPV